MERRSATGVEVLAAEASRLSTRRKSHSLTVDEKAEKARPEAERRNVTRAEMVVAEAIRKSARRKTDPLTAEQKAEKSVADATRYRETRLTVDQKAEKVRIETERWNAESSQAAVFRLLDLTRSGTVADPVVVNALASNKLLNDQLESNPVISSARFARAS